MSKICYCLCIVVSFIACRQEASRTESKPSVTDTFPSVQEMIADPSIPGNFSTQTSLVFDSSRIDSFLKKYPLFLPYEKDLRHFYRVRGYAYAWFDHNGLIEQSEDIYHRLSNLHEEGLPEKIMYMPEFTSLMESAGMTAAARPVPDPETEIMFTSEYFNYARNVWTGIPEKESKELEWYLPRKKLDYQGYLDSVLLAMQRGDSITEPVHNQYHRLKLYLKKFREAEKNNGWVIVHTDKKKFTVGDTGRAIQDIRKKLFFNGDLTNDNQSPVFDEELVQGVKSYQERYGLNQDGIVGPALLKEMNAPLEKRIRQIIVNMERARWVTSTPVADFLLVNIPQFKLTVIENNKLAWQCNVVVGKEMHKTVIFGGNLKYVVFSPYWNIPPGILKNETLPAIKRDPGYLRKNNMEWNGGKVRQKPGPNNALGKVKFLFPNSYNIYLHDTPSKPLFKEEKRAFSHGCIRVSEPRKLALYLLRKDSAWNESSVDAAMNSGKEKYVTLKQTVPVNIVYFTAWVDEQGRLNFRDDVYKRDNRLLESIFQKSNMSGQ